MPASYQGLLLGLILVAVVTGFGSMNTIFLPIAFVTALVLPFYLYNQKKDIMMCSFLTATVFSLISCLIVSRRVIFSIYSLGAVQVFLALVLVFGALSIAILIMCTIIYIISGRRMPNQKI